MSLLEVRTGRLCRQRTAAWHPQLIRKIGVYRERVEYTLRAPARVEPETSVPGPKKLLRVAELCNRVRPVYGTVCELSLQESRTMPIPTSRDMSREPGFMSRAFCCPCLALCCSFWPSSLTNVNCAFLGAELRRI